MGGVQNWREETYNERANVTTVTAELRPTANARIYLTYGYVGRDAAAAPGLIRDRLRVLIELSGVGTEWNLEGQHDVALVVDGARTSFPESGYSRSVVGCGSPPIEPCNLTERVSVVMAAEEFAALAHATTATLRVGEIVIPLDEEDLRDLREIAATMPRLSG